MPKTKLYAVAYSKLVRGRWKTGFICHVEAESSEMARNMVIRTNKSQVDIIAAGPSIGYFVEDNQGKILSCT